MKNLADLKQIGNDKGFAVVLIAIAMIALVGFVAIAIDVGYAYLVKGQLQNAADAGALAGAGAIYPDNSSPSPAFPSPDFTEAEASASRFVRCNNAAGAVLTNNDIVSIRVGYWNLAQNPAGIQPQSTIPTGKCSTSGNMCSPTAVTGCAAIEPCLFQDVPAVQVTLQKSVPTFFARVFGFEAFSPRAAAVSAIGFPKKAQHVFPIAVTKCMVDDLFAAGHPTPLPDVEIGNPYGRVPGCNTGQWTSFTYCDPSASQIKNILSGKDETPPLSIGTGICISTGVMASLVKEIPIGEVLELPVVADATLTDPNTPTPISGFVSFEVVRIVGNGANGIIQGHFLSYRRSPNFSSPGGPMGNTVTPPALIK
ncbi:MAG: hypothetical protein A2075_08805 [Geobacteraceae bacterium GWC2_58_44]|nr:MAG: hypothetical protein A2075_08805 [Geobacteraceae bacterium GWC2_58_44]